MDKQANIQEIKQLIDQLQQVVGGQPACSSSVQPITRRWQDFDVKNFLGISQRTLERRRADGKIKSHKVGGRCYYLPQNILDLKNEFLK